MSLAYSRIREGSDVPSPTRSRSQRLPALSSSCSHGASARKPRASVSLWYWPSDGKVKRALAGKPSEVYWRISDTTTWDSEVQVDDKGENWDGNGRTDNNKEEDQDGVEVGEYEQRQRQKKKRNKGGRSFLGRAWKRLFGIRSSSSG